MNKKSRLKKQHPLCCLAVSMVALAMTVAPLWADEWTQLAPGLELREFLIPDQIGDLSGEQGALAVLRIDSRHYALNLGAALIYGSALTVQEWSRRSGFSAVINAGMFRADDRFRSTGYMRDGRVSVNSYLHPDYGAFLLFDPLDTRQPAWRWVDRKEDDNWEDLLRQYAGVVQNYRLISRSGENLWGHRTERHSMAAVAMDRGNRLLFIHCRPRLSMFEFAEALLDLPLDLIGAMYVEGGADASMYVDAGQVVRRWVGEYRSDFFQGSNKNFWPTPNVLGVRPK